MQMIKNFIYQKREEVSQIPICRTDTKGALLYGLNPYVRSARPNSSAPECLGCVTAFRTRGSIPCAAMRLSLHEKGVTTFVTPFAYLTVLRTPR